MRVAHHRSSLLVFSLALAGNVFALAQTSIEPGSFYIFVDKQANQLTLRTMATPSKVLKSYRAITGENSGDKIKEGDRKTPEGVYFISGLVPDSMIVRNLHGSAGVSLNYPNPADRINQQTGSGIWIHGVESEARLEKRFDTKGCVALGNEDILELKKLVSPGVTPVVIVDNEVANPGMGLISSDHPLKKRILDWARAWSVGTHEEYIAFYHSEFYSRGMNFKRWDNYKKSLKTSYKFIKIDVENLQLFRHPKYTVADFDQIYESDRYRSRGHKRLYLVGPEDSAQIIAEESMTMKPGFSLTQAGEKAVSGVPATDSKPADGG
jgi:murein L,D-transpeptidase YafK